ncbi:S46 family peptidase [Myroides marinus]|uniref:S46 family peptidase n=1 Tax=Myroides marinus TaxID=703342 RepID=UPI00257525A5|nr:S46 family peptidase [Myroides marinus]MDM1349450.1 S46 family peptidase [Myroides marinus]MDM1356660.1 S46 family peptidase [Myroides marinus]MDM1363802.1 S46 family peptidase [Myroides marinus]MDM1379243.1 S46 family peptidase [Myroides marinus]MDM1386428.1 S46 family peptidase [Myroides marinus]
MKKIVLFLTAFILAIPTTVKADEGMWFLMFIERLNQRDMQKMGLKLTAEEIYSINKHSLKDAIVQFDGGCTAEIISNQGLVLTNHHCGYDKIAALSTPEDDILTNGFWAKDKATERPAKGLSVRFFVKMDDVTKRILSVVNDKMTELEREKAINQEIAKIQKENDGNGKYTVSVRSFFQGNEFYYFVYEDYKDVRLVGTPPNSIGKFGGDTDNWEWPRHTGDFSLFRVYTDKNGNPAEYSPENVPMVPKHHLPVSITGIQEGDFSMILGYPGRTNRWMPAQGVNQNINYAYPAWVEGSKLGMDVMKKYMATNDAVRLNYASKYAGVANYWKNRQGMIDALNQHQTVATKTKAENEFHAWASKKGNADKYGNVIADINAWYAATNEKARHDNYLMTMLRTSAFAAAPYRLAGGLEAYAAGDAKKRAEMLSEFKEFVNSIYDGKYEPLEREMLAKQLALYASKSKGYAIAPYVEQINKEYNGDFEKYVDESFDKSIFADKESIEEFLADPKSAVVSRDPLFKLSLAIMEHNRAKSDELAALEDKYQKAYRLFVDGVQKSNPTGKYYPDANSTLRLTYGTVKDLPRGNKVNDAKENWFTTLKGTVAKHKAGDEEFEAPQKLIDLYNKKDYGVYADKAGHMPVNFLTNHDITGGNSGSPVLNGKGELIGLAFDGNIEAMAGDVIYDPKLQRTINVDIRYVLFIIDKFADAKHIVDEMTIVK